MKLLQVLLFAVCLNAQRPVEVIPCRQGAQPTSLPPCTAGRPDYLQGLRDSLQQGVDTARFVRELQIKQQYLGLAERADKRAQEEYDLAMRRGTPDPGAALDLRNRMMEELRLRNTQLSPSLQVADWKINQGVNEAFAAARVQHPDFDVLRPAIDIIAGSLKPDWKGLTPSEYLESLYAIAKHASFAEQVRDVLLRKDSTR